MDEALQAKVEQLWETPRVKAVRDVFDRLETARAEQQKRDNPHSEFYQSQSAKPLMIDDIDKGFYMMAEHAGLLNEEIFTLAMIMDCCGRFHDHPDMRALLTANEIAAIQHILKITENAYKGEVPDPSAFFADKNDTLVKFALVSGVGGALMEDEDTLKEAMSNPDASNRITSLIANACEYLQETRKYVDEPEMTEKLLVACDRLLPMMKPGFLTKAFGSSAAQLKKQVMLHKSNKAPKV